MNLTVVISILILLLTESISPPVSKACWFGKCGSKREAYFTCMKWREQGPKKEELVEETRNPNPDHIPDKLIKRWEDQYQEEYKPMDTDNASSKKNEFIYLPTRESIEIKKQNYVAQQYADKVIRKKLLPVRECIYDDSNKYLGINKEGSVLKRFGW